jgi:Polysaccharide lyase
VSRYRAAVLLIMAVLLMAWKDAASAPSQRLVERFEEPGFSEAGGLYYKRNKEQAAGTVEFQGAVTHGGKGALKLSVKPLCPASDEDCSERAEVWERPEAWVSYDQGVWYGVAVRLEQPVPQDNHRFVIAQWKREIDGTPGDFSPFLAIRLNRGKLFATVETNLVSTSRVGPIGKSAHCPAGETPVWLRPETNQTRALVAISSDWNEANGARFNACTSEIRVVHRGNDLPAAGSGWIDFAIYSKPGPDGAGHIEIFANSGWVATITGRIGHAEKGLGKHQYFKFGPYRAPHSNIWTLYYDDFRRSPDCKDVLTETSCPF